ncbi:PAS domain-containing protein [Kordiimonas aestuarii]|uniref:PAS domain-containing protein n=1 Tax=Kordiimonas aestuarii TaxID=1005925 RepID=UPI0021D36802|nr:PAS domain-containing protein [Kordiimonas aestuarii]
MSYFEAKTGGQRLAKRGDISPVELKSYLSEICIFGALYDGDSLEDLVVQLMGTTVASFYGEITGQTVTEGAASAEIAERILVSCRRVVETGCAVLAEAATLSEEKNHLRVRVLYVPLSEDGQHIDRIFGHVRVRLRSAAHLSTS